MEVQIKQITCCLCGIVFCITNDYNNELVKSHKSFFCPNGHSQSYVLETDADKFKKMYESERRSKEQLYNEKEKLLKSIHGYKGILGKLKKNCDKNER